MGRVCERRAQARLLLATPRSDPISHWYKRDRGARGAGWGTRAACGVGGRLCKRGWAHAKRVDGPRPRPLRSLQHYVTSLTLTTSNLRRQVKAEKGAFRKRESEICFHFRNAVHRPRSGFSQINHRHNSARIHCYYKHEIFYMFAKRHIRFLLEAI